MQVHYFHKIGKYSEIMDLFLLIGFYKVTNQVNSAFNFLRDPQTMEDQDDMWRENEITLDQLQSQILME